MTTAKNDVQKPGDQNALLIGRIGANAAPVVTRVLKRVGASAKYLEVPGAMQLRQERAN